MDSRWVDLERRVARAERQARALAGLVLVVLSGGTMVLAARTAETRSPGSTVRAPFRVVDARGNALLVVDTGEWNDHWDAPGGTRLRLFDLNRRPTAVLMAAEDGGDLSLDREGGNRSIGLFAGGGGAALTFENPRNQGIPQPCCRPNRMDRLSFSTTGAGVAPPSWSPPERVEGLSCTRVSGACSERRKPEGASAPASRCPGDVIGSRCLGARCCPTREREDPVSG